MSREQNLYTLEIRYRPNSKIVDHRGDWAEKISAHMDLPHWAIVENRLDIFDAEERNRCFVGFRSCGYVVESPPTNNFFADQATKFFKCVAGFNGFQTPLTVERIGQVGRKASVRLRPTSRPVAPMGRQEGADHL